MPAVQPWPGGRPAPQDPLQLHPTLWRASQLGGGRRAGTASGHAALDAELPEGGWPHGVLTELLLPRPGLGELRLLAPALASAGGGEGHGGGAGPAGLSGPTAGLTAGPWGGTGHGAQGPGCVMLFDPPASLSAWALLQQGVHPRHWLVLRPRRARPAAQAAGWPLLPEADMLWGMEQALRSGQVAAVLAWLPQDLRADTLRRLQLAAQAHPGPVFVFRSAQAAARPSPAPLRLLLQPTAVDALAVRILKRRGPALARVLRLALPPVLSPQQHARALTRQVLQSAAQPSATPSVTPPPTPPHLRAASDALPPPVLGRLAPT